jgi:hypothetical protein
VTAIEKQSKEKKHFSAIFLKLATLEASWKTITIIFLAGLVTSYCTLLWIRRKNRKFFSEDKTALCLGRKGCILNTAIFSGRCKKARSSQTVSTLNQVVWMYFLHTVHRYMLCVVKLMSVSQNCDHRSIYSNVYIHTYIHTLIHTCILVHVHICMYVCMNVVCMTCLGECYSLGMKLNLFYIQTKQPLRSRQICICRKKNTWTWLLCTYCIWVTNPFFRILFKGRSRSRVAAGPVEWLGL